MTRSVPPAARWVPSGENATEYAWPAPKEIGSPVERGARAFPASHSRTVPSADAAASVDPDQASAQTALLGPSGAGPINAGCLGSVTSHSSTWSSKPPVANARPSGENGGVDPIGVRRQRGPDRGRPGRIGDIPQQHLVVEPDGDERAAVRGERR